MGVVLCVGFFTACRPEPRPPRPEPIGERVAPPRPGESITRTKMCSCVACEPEACCHELGEPPPEIKQGCSNGYDFTECASEVTSCAPRCFQRRWRVRIERGCMDARPRDCCADAL